MHFGDARARVCERHIDYIENRIPPLYNDKYIYRNFVKSSRAHKLILQRYASN